MTTGTCTRSEPSSGGGGAGRFALIAVVTLIIGLFAAAAATWSGAFGDLDLSRLPGRQQRHTITGTMTLQDEVIPLSGSGCFGGGGYSDIRTGAPVTVKNEKGTLIGTGSLDPGQMVGQLGSRECVFPFTVEDVRDADFFQVEVSRRGVLSYSKADLKKSGWTVQASIGS